LTLSTLRGGTSTITATYNGSPNFSGSSSPSALSQTVNAAGTSTNVAASPNPAAVGQMVTLTASVANTSDTGAIPTGTVTFKDVVNGVTTTLGTRSLVDSIATFTTSSLTSGSHLIEAFFNLNTDFLASSGNVVETVI
jgi:large repetitive protein